jgi:hypothetical protein
MSIFVLANPLLTQDDRLMIEGCYRTCWARLSSGHLAKGSSDCSVLLEGVGGTRHVIASSNSMQRIPLTSTGE